MSDAATPHVSFRDLSVNYGAKRALDGLTLDIPRQSIFGIIGPANSGKTTMLKCINRTIDFVTGVKLRGQVLVDGMDVLRPATCTPCGAHRHGVPAAVGLPLSVYENVAYAPRMAGMNNSAELDELWRPACARRHVGGSEDRMQLLGRSCSADSSSGLPSRARCRTGPRSCVSTSSPSRRPGNHDEDRGRAGQVKEKMTIVLVTNLVQQAHRLADHVAFLNSGKLIEVDTCKRIFSEHPREN